MAVFFVKGTVKTKRPSCRYRGRPRNLFSSYTNWQQKNQMVENTYLTCQTFLYDYIMELSSGEKFEYKISSLNF
jgi:hypothetical protein